MDAAEIAGPQQARQRPSTHGASTTRKEAPDGQEASRLGQKPDPPETGVACRDLDGAEGAGPDGTGATTATPRTATWTASRHGAQPVRRGGSGQEPHT